MSIFHNGVLGFIPEKDWLTVGFDVRRQGDPIDGLFGDERTDNMVAYWQSLASDYMLPGIAQFHAFDAEAQKAVRIPVDTRSIEKGLIKVKRNTSELLRAATRAGVQGDRAIYEYVMNDGLALSERVITRTKVAKNELLATGKVTIKENDLDVTVDYGVPVANLRLELDFGVGATKDIPSQLQAIVDNAKEQGVTLTGMATSGAVLTKLRQDPAVQKAVNGNIGAGALVRNQALRAYLQDEFELQTVITNDLMYTTEDGVDANGRPKVKRHRYFPKNRVSFFATNSGGRVGTGLWGDPPEVEAARYFEGGVAASGESPFVFISQWAEKDPAALWTKASALFMPVLYNPYGLFSAAVKETEG